MSVLLATGANARHSLAPLRSLLRSDLVAELNQTVIDVQRMDSLMAEKNFLVLSVSELL